MEGKHVQFLRPRILTYSGLLILMLSGLAYSMATHIPLELDIIRDHDVLYRETSEGLIENAYTLKVINMDDKTHTYLLDISGLEPIIVSHRQMEMTVSSGETANFLVQIKADPIHLKKPSYDLAFRLRAVDMPELTVTEAGRFIGPSIE